MNVNNTSRTYRVKANGETWILSRGEYRRFLYTVRDLGGRALNDLPAYGTRWDAATDGHTDADFDTPVAAEREIASAALAVLNAAN